MSEHFEKWLRRSQQQRPPEALNTTKIDTGYRLFWTKIALAWDAPRRAEVYARVAAFINSAAFENNALERRFHVDGVDDQAHSGASLLALLEVLRALDRLEDTDLEG